MKTPLILVGVGVGAALMYALDPQQGNRRRALARAKLTKAAHKTGRAVGATSRDVAHRATGLAASVHSRFFEDNAPDEVVEARVRARLGRISSHPSAIEVTASNGVITLRGPVLRTEVQEVVRGVSSVRGVQSIDNRLEPHEADDRVPGLQGHAARAVTPAQSQRSPSARLLIGMAGAVLATIGVARRDKLGVLAGGVGVVLMTRAVSDTAVDQLAELIARPEHADAPGVSIPVKIGPAPGSFGRPPSGTPPDRVH